MNQQIKEKWVKALRSGKYQQGIGELYNNRTKSFCCLGVLCDLYNKEHKEDWMIDGEKGLV